MSVVGGGGLLRCGRRISAKFLLLLSELMKRGERKEKQQNTTSPNDFHLKINSLPINNHVRLEQNLIYFKPFTKDFLFAGWQMEMPVC